MGLRERKGLLGRSGRQAVDPSLLSGLVLWLKADAIAGGVDGSGVATWADQSGGGHDAVQATSGRQPLFKTGILGGLPVVRFDGTDDCLVIASAAALNPAGLTIGAVFFPTAAGSEQALVSKWAGSWVLDDIGGTPKLFLNGVTGSPLVAAAGATLNGWNRCLASYDGSSGLLLLNGVAGAAASLSGDVAASATDVGVGSYPTPGVAAFPGDIAEVVIYGRGLPLAELQALDGYWKQKYSLA